MKTQRDFAIAVAVAALLSGCASGGGSSGSGSGSPQPDPALAPLRPGYEPSPCGTLYGYPVPCQPLRPDFSSGGSSGSGRTNYNLDCLWNGYCTPITPVVAIKDVLFS